MKSFWKCHRRHELPQHASSLARPSLFPLFMLYGIFSEKVRKELNFL